MTATLTHVSFTEQGVTAFPKLKPEIKAEWVSRLRSGNYPQGKSRLKKADGTYCCLGVLSEMAAEAGVVPFELDPETGSYNLKPTADHVGIDAWTTQSVAKWAFETNPENGGNWRVFHPVDNLSTTLAWLNDNGHTFPEIATVIEEQF